MDQQAQSSVPRAHCSQVRRLLPPCWRTERVEVTDSTLAEAPDLQRIYDAVPQVGGWTRVEGQDEPAHPMRAALQEGVLPPTPDSSKAFFRLQSIRLPDTDELIGFLGVYHGFPQPDTLWINVIALHPTFQGQGYGSEVLIGLCGVVRQLESYARVRTYVRLTNWPSLRMCVKAGLDRMVRIAGDRVHSGQAEAHVMLEGSLAS